VNNRIFAEVKQSAQRATPEMLPVRWLAWSGAFSLLLATLLAALILPQQAGRRSDADFSSQVISTRAESPYLSVSEFRAPDQRGVVLWIEGADYIPTEATVR
jgi:hypothetical protein